MSGDQAVDGSHATTSPKGTYTFVATSDMDVVAQRRVEDRHFVCPISGKSNRRRADFVVHYQTRTGEKPYACDVCEKECTTQGNLNTHRRTHTGEELYFCVMCKKKCATEDGLDKHHRTHTLEEIIYKCPVCGKAFTDSSTPNARFRNLHNEKLTLFNDLVKQFLILKWCHQELF
ncbi:Zinc finger protein 782 [Araneus ventricosus]|uniref:Zinc finger protein 782 n=1 Tax=Araneus ventricosus TaxID=182803 RepID=A0A4Y2UEA3_ARAVE|nr:Zinc finger protein 782 [Araneus ventricosus]